jgi:hypothetical protein
MAKMILMISLVAQLVSCCARSRLLVPGGSHGEEWLSLGPEDAYLPVKGMAAASVEGFRVWCLV